MPSSSSLLDGGGAKRCHSLQGHQVSEDDGGGERRSGTAAVRLAVNQSELLEGRGDRVLLLISRVGAREEARQPAARRANQRGGSIRCRLVSRVRDGEAGDDVA